MGGEAIVPEQQLEGACHPAPWVGGRFPEDGELNKGKAWNNRGLPAIFSSVPVQRYFKAAARKLACLPGFVDEKNIITNLPHQHFQALHHLQPSIILNPPPARQPLHQYNTEADAWKKGFSI